MIHTRDFRPSQLPEIIRWSMVESIELIRDQIGAATVNAFIRFAIHNLVAHWDTVEMTFSLTVSRACQRADSGVLSIREVLDLLDTPPCPAASLFPSDTDLSEKHEQLDSIIASLWNPQIRARESGVRLVSSIRWSFILFAELIVDQMGDEDRDDMAISEVLNRLNDPDPQIEDYLRQCATVAVLIESGCRPKFFEDFKGEYESCGVLDELRGGSIPEAIVHLMNSVAKDKDGDRTEN